ncbi:MAG: methionine--tRNA ligase [Candidatus Anstonellales archaeon]
MEERIVVTAALPYANGELHLGHIRSTYLPADIYTRFMKALGKDAIYVCATDEHGTPIVAGAEKEGVSAEEFVKKYHEKDKETFRKLLIDFDVFHRTSSKENKEMTLLFFQRAKERGYIYTKEVELYYCETCNRFLPDRFVIGICPHCGAEDQYSDGCEACGRTIGPGEIKEPKCSVCRKKPSKKRSEHSFFNLKAFGPKLEEWIKGNKEMQDEVKNYVLNWIKEGLVDWDIVRDLDWGVPAEKGKVFYVWFDAPIGYISSTVALTPKWKEYWNGRIVHFIGKDIVYHHYLFWPAMIMAADIGIKLPSAIPVRGHLTLEGRKFSKSRKHYITVDEFLQVFPAEYLRYYETQITPFSLADSDFNLDDFANRINNDLVGNIGNFAKRVSVLAEKLGFKYEESEEERRMREDVAKLKEEVVAEVERFRIKEALDRIVNENSRYNALLNEREPWKNAEVKNRTLTACANWLKALGPLLSPYLPESSRKISEMVGGKCEWEEIGQKAIKIGRIGNLFRKIDRGEIEKIRGMLQKRAQ